MKKIALLVAVAMVISAPALAAAKKKKAAAPTQPQVTDSNEQSFRLVRDSLPVWLPSWSIPLYMKAKESQEQGAASAAAAPKPKKAKKAAKTAGAS